MKNKFVQIALGILTGIGGYLEVGSIATSAEAGASFGYSLIWAIVLGTICLIFLIEMSGRLAATSHHTIADAVRERFGFRFAVIPSSAELIVNLLVLAAEIGGVCLALKLVTGIEVRVWAAPVVLFLWFALWVGTLDVIENSTSILGLVTVAFVVAAVKMHPDYAQVARSIVPSLPHHDPAHYWFTAVSILGATISPYMFVFYSSGAVEERWSVKDLGMNRATAAIGMTFGAVMASAVLVVSAHVFHPLHITVDRYEQIAVVLTPALHKYGLPLFAISLGVCCFGACVEVALATTYGIAQTFGWMWGEDKKPAERTRFSVTYTLIILVAMVVLLTGIDPLKLTVMAMALTALILPLVVFPFVVLLNDETYVHGHRNGPIGNAVVIVTIFLASIIAIVTIPLQIVGD